MDRDEGGTGDIFAADSIGFKTSSTTILIIMAVLFFFGAVFELIKFVRGRKKVENIGKFSKKPFL